MAAHVLIKKKTIKQKATTNMTCFISNNYKSLSFKNLSLSFATQKNHALVFLSKLDPSLYLEKKKKPFTDFFGF